MIIRFRGMCGADFLGLGGVTVAARCGGALMRAFLSGCWHLRKAIALYIVLIVCGVVAGDALREVIIPEPRPMNEPLMFKIVVLSLIAFLITAAIPFIPGAEIGFALLIVFGAQAAPWVYLAMVAALMLSFTVARLIPPPRLAAALAWLGLARAARFVGDMAAIPVAERAAVLTEQMSSQIGGRIMQNRYIALALALNLPGNSLIGGGGGLAFAAGASGLFTYRGFLRTILLAVAPVPVAFLLM